LESLAKCGADVFLPGFHLFTLDLKDAYKSLFMEERALPFNCFEHEGRYYVALILLFGHRFGPLWFTKILRPVLGLFRILGMPVLGYIDDIAGGGKPGVVRARASFADKVMRCLGWLVSPKSCLEGAPVVRSLGLLVDAGRQLYIVPEDKLAWVLTMVEELLVMAKDSRPLCRRALWTLEGTLGSLHLAVPQIMLSVRDMATARARYSRAPSSGKVWLTETELANLQAIPTILAQHNGAPIRPLQVTLSAHGDAGAHGLGIVVHWPQGDERITWELTEEEMSQSSTARELAPWEYLLRDHGERLRGQVVQPLMDSRNAVRDIMRHGTCTGEQAHERCRRLLVLCRTYEIVLQPLWVPRERNKTADALSKLFASGILRPTIRARLQQEFGTSAVFAPKFTAVGTAARALAQQHAQLVVVHPVWPTQAWWPTIAGATTRHVLLGAYKEVFECGHTCHTPPATWRFRASLIVAGRFY
jgi:hypothetical protein